MEIPLYIDGRQAGSFCMAQSGLYTLLEANADGCAQRLIRLWAHGEGGSAYLGVMQPWRGGLWLRRKLSRRELEHFPAPIAFVSDREHEGEEGNRDESLHNMSTLQTESIEDQEIKSLHNQKQRTIEQAENDSHGLHNIKTDLYRCPWPAAPAVSWPKTSWPGATSRPSTAPPSTATSCARRTAAAPRARRR